MAALTKDRDTPRRDDARYGYPVAASTRLYAGGLVALNASGYAVPASAVATLTVMGWSVSPADNSTGAAGDINVLTETRGAIKLANDGSITRAHVGKKAYAVDDQTVAATDGSGTRPAAGIIKDLDASGVWVGF